MIESIGATLGADRALVERAGLGQEDFLEILLTQLTFQDPLEPLDNQEFVAQLAQFTNLEQSRLITENTEFMLRLETIAQSISLIGRTVEVRTDTETVVGRVQTITLDDQGQPRLTIVQPDGSFLSDIGLSQIAIVNGVPESQEGV
jgi:flagellar basal-body rod modification protein FlgD